MNRQQRALLISWGPVVLYMAVIFAASSLPGVPDLPSGISDKMVHFVEYAVLGLLLARALAGPRWPAVTVAHVATAIALALLYGISDELHQGFVPGRDADVPDVGADVLGACASTGALWAWGIIRRNF